MQRFYLIMPIQVGWKFRKGQALCSGPLGYRLDRRRPRGQVHHIALSRPGEQGAVRQNRRLHPPAAGQIDDLECGAIQLQRLRCGHRTLHGPAGSVLNLDLSESLRDQYAQDQYRASGSRQ